MSGTLLKPIKIIGAKVYVSIWENNILAGLPNKVFTFLGSMMYLKLGSPDGVNKIKFVWFGSAEVSSGLASCPTITDASIFCSNVLHVLVSSETF